MKRIWIYIKSLLLPMFVTLDGRDGTISVSEKVYDRLMELGLKTNNCLYMFRVGQASFGFGLWPQEKKDETHTYELQYNSKTKTVGFAPTCPTVATVLYEFGLPHDAVAKCKVSLKNANGYWYFRLSKR